MKLVLKAFDPKRIAEPSICLVVGLTGSGKSFLCRALAKENAREAVIVPNHLNNKDYKRLSRQSAGKFLIVRGSFHELSRYTTLYCNNVLQKYSALIDVPRIICVPPFVNLFADYVFLLRPTDAADERQELWRQFFKEIPFDQFLNLLSVFNYQRYACLVLDVRSKAPLLERLFYYKAE